MAVPKRMRPASGRRDRGATALEFALILPLFLVLLMGIINYGLWFNDSLTLRQGVREAARQAVLLQTFSGTGCSGTTGMDNVACGAKAQITGSSGLAYVKIFPVTTWARGQQVVICGMVPATNFTGFVPLPAPKFIKSETTMSIENIIPTPSPTFHTDTLPTPTEANWTWCTP